jgi:hypothetical protein
MSHPETVPFPAQRTASSDGFYSQSSQKVRKLEMSIIVARLEKFDVLTRVFKCLFQRLFGIEEVVYHVRLC